MTLAIVLLIPAIQILDDASESMSNTSSEVEDIPIKLFPQHHKVMRILALWMFIVFSNKELYEGLNGKSKLRSND